MLYIMFVLFILFVFFVFPVMLVKRLMQKEREHKLEDAKELMRYQYELEHQNEKK